MALERTTKTAAQVLASSKEFEQESLCNLLMVGDYDPQQRVFVREDGMMCVILEVIAGDCSTQDDEHLNSVAESTLSQAFQALPDGTIFSATVFPSRYIEDSLQGFEKFRTASAPGFPRPRAARRSSRR